MSILIIRNRGIRTGAVVNQATVWPESRALTEAVEAESESPMLHQSKWTPIWVSILIIRNKGIRTGAVVNQAIVWLESRALTEAVEVES